MVTTRELEHVVAQVNVKFKQLNDEIVKLKKQIGEKNASKKRSKTS